MITLVGALAQPELMAALQLTGRSVAVPGRLSGGARAGIDPDAWPGLERAQASRGTGVAGLEVRATPALEAYAGVMDVPVLDWDGRQVMGAQAGARDGAWHPDPVRDRLAAEIARQIIEAPGQAVGRVAMIGVWAASRLRAARMAPSGQGVVPLRGPDATEVLERAQPYAGYFAVARQRLTHARHDGGRTPPLTREVLVSGDAAVLLPWDPRRDRVMVIEQFRFAPLLRGDPQPWQLEPIAGRIDAGETPEAAILREAHEEADLSLSRLIAAGGCYPSPGTLAEFLYHFVGIADLPDGVAGTHGLASEAEDIRGHLLERRALSEMVARGLIVNGPLMMLSLWLDARAGEFAGELAGEPDRQPAEGLAGGPAGSEPTGG